LSKGCHRFGLKIHPQLLKDFPIQGLRIDTKVYNWKTLNRKVLQQFGMNLDTETMTSLAQARPGCIEKILWDLKQTLSGRLRQKDGTYFDDYTEIPDIAALEAAQSASDQKLLDQKIQESEEQAEYISALEAKIVKLEELMRLKDAKIAKLTASSKKPKR
jgi:hypothetical protein